MQTAKAPTLHYKAPEKILYGQPFKNEENHFELN